VIVYGRLARSAVAIGGFLLGQSSN
jgi:hypothetical protein